MNAGCLEHFSKTTVLEELKDEPYLLDKDRGMYNRRYSKQHTLKLPLLTDPPGILPTCWWSYVRLAL
ncbi:MAG: hypothetical protein LPD71_04730 [Shewanella sp.]|nr:hypothetical protein [Shewanella sp.]MCF1431591.1 hypothetical protein [Shewanella sp.]MCF1438068.1 hypothetical protein [Shewanella sp.]MCF1458323.1 hypothetical protein [Shewanella sp.]